MRYDPTPPLFCTARRFFLGGHSELLRPSLALLEHVGRAIAVRQLVPKLASTSWGFPARHGDTPIAGWFFKWSQTING